MQNIRECAVAGMFYPGKRDELMSMIEELTDKSEGSPERDIHGVIVPHAGYMYSGKTASYAFRKLPKGKFRRVVVLGPNHTVYTDKAVMDTNDVWRTPLGDVKIEYDKVPDIILRDERPHKREHSIEAEIPFLQYYLGDFMLVPIIIGDITDEDAKEYAKAINSMMDDETLLVVSTDLSHFLSQEEAEEIDGITISNIQAMQGEFEACGKNPLKVLTEISRMNDWEIKLVHRSTSAESSGDRSSVVGYASFVF